MKKVVLLKKYCIFAFQTSKAIKMKRIVIFSVFLLGFLLLSFAQEHQYLKDRYGNMIGDTLDKKDTVLNYLTRSVKSRWNIKASLSLHENSEYRNHVEWRHNLWVVCNYGILNYLETGGYIGYVRYYNSVADKIDFAPAFGINANLYLLQILGKKQKCRWDLYLTANYGGAYLIHHYPFYFDNNGEIYREGRRYCQIFGAGIGSSFYFWKGLGIYAEVLAGQYAYFKEIYPCHCTVRGGFSYTFRSKSKKQ